DGLRRRIRWRPGQDRLVTVEIADAWVNEGGDAVAVVGQRAGGEGRVVVGPGGHPGTCEDHVGRLGAWVQPLEGERVQRLWGGFTRSDAASGAKPPVEVPRDTRERDRGRHQARVDFSEVDDLDAAQAHTHWEQVLTVGGRVAEQVDRHQVRVGHLVAGAGVGLVRDGAHDAEVVLQPVDRADSAPKPRLSLELRAREQLRVHWSGPVIDVVLDPPQVRYAADQGAQACARRD